MSDTIWTPENASATPSLGNAEVRSVAWNNFLLSDESYSGRWRTAAEVRITPETALQSTCVLAASRILSETIATLPIHVYRRGDNGERTIAADIPLYKVLTFAPNEWQTKFEFFEQLIMNLALWGNNYTLIKSGRFGSVSALLNLHPSRMDVERLENGRLRYNYTDPETGKHERYSQDEIMHVRWTPEPDGIKGMVPVEIAREAIALARACEIHAAKYWANSARPGIVLTTDGTLSAEAAEKLRDNWERLHRGVDRAYKTAILTGGLKPEQIGFTSEQSQFIDQRRYQCEEIARVYRLPLHLIQGTPGGNLEIQGQEFVTYTLMPWLKRIESAISRSLIWNDDLFFAEFDVRGLLRADSNSRASYYSTMMSLGILSVNEIRKLENLAPLGPEGDKHFIAMNVQPLEEAGKPKQDPMAAMLAGGGAPPPKDKGVPSLPGAKTGEAPLEMPKGEGSQKKPSDDEDPESRDCGRQGGGMFGKGNTCAADDGGSNVSGGSAPKRKRKRGSDYPASIRAGSSILKKSKAFRPVSGTRNSDYAKPVSDEALRAALPVNKKDKAGAPRSLPEGSGVALRIDIPTFENKGVYAVTVHKSTATGFNPSPVGYDSVARLSGPVQFESKENEAVLVATGDSNKFPLATVKGRYSKDRSIPKGIDSWTAVGYDPQKTAYFYDKKTGQEVTGGTDAISVGNSVFVRIPKYGKRKAQTQYRECSFWGLESRGISDSTQAFHDAMVTKAEETGKLSHEAAAYSPTGQYPKTCASCIFFHGGSCEIVEEPVSADGICRFYESGGGGGEERDCGRDDGGKFGTGNECAKDGISNSKGEFLRDVRKGRNKRQTKVARKLYQMQSSEKQIKRFIRQIGGKVRNSRVEIDSTPGDEGVNIFVRDKDMNETHVVHFGYYGVVVYPSEKISQEDADRITEAAKPAFPEKISDRLWAGGKEFPISVKTEPSDFIRPEKSAKKDLQYGKEGRDCGTGSGGFKPGNDCAKGGAEADLPKSFPSGSKKYRSAIDSVVASSGLDSKKIWDRSKGLVGLPEKNEIRKIADEQAAHSGKPMDPPARKAYGSLVEEIGRQYQALLDSGLKVKAWKGEGEPYGDPPGSAKPNSDKMREEIAKSGEYSFFMTEKGFGTGEATADHPMLQETKFKTSDGEPMIANDLFRVVHDFVAHVRGGHSFSTRGEYNGMLTHASTLPDSAWPALFAETFGQNAVYELTGGYATQNAYASQAGSDLIRQELAREKRAAAEESDTDEPLGYQHVKTRPWLLGDLDKTEQRDCGQKGDGTFGAGNTCAAEGGTAGSDKAQPAGTKAPKKSNAEKIIEKIASNPDGFTIHPASQDQPTDGIMVAEFANDDKKRSLQLSSADIKSPSTAKALEDWLSQNADAIDGRDDRYIGGWNDGGQFYLDISTRYPPEKAKEALDSGRNWGQLAVFNLGTLKTTWVKYGESDPKKPEGWDNAFAKARKDAAESQVYDLDTPAMDEEDWAKELSKHGQTTVRSLMAMLADRGYTTESRTLEKLFERATDERTRKATEARRADGRQPSGGVQSISSDGREAGRGRRRDAGSGVVQGWSGGSTGPVSGTQQEVEPRANCGRTAGGTFAKGNTCAADDGAKTLDRDLGDGIRSKESADKEYSSDDLRRGKIPGAEKLESLSVKARTSQEPSKVISLLGFDSVASLLKAGAGLSRKGHVAIDIQDDQIAVTASYPVDTATEKEGESWEGYVHSDVSIVKEGDETVVAWDSFMVEDEEIPEQDRARISSVLAEVALDAARAAEENGVSKIETLAAGSIDSELKGYRLWPQFGFDGRIGYQKEKDLPKEIKDSLPRRAIGTGDISVQELISTPEGKKWWSKNGITTYMSLDLKKTNTLGYQKYQKKLSLLDRLRGRNKERSWHPELIEGVESRSDDCGRQEGGKFGKGNDCAADGKSGSTATKDKPKKKASSQKKKATAPRASDDKSVAQLRWKPGDKIPNVVANAVAAKSVTYSEDGKSIVSSTVADQKDIYNFAGKDWVSTVRVGEHLAGEQARTRGGKINTAKAELSADEHEYMVSSIEEQTKSALDRGVTPDFYSPKERAKQVEEFSNLIPQVKGGRTSNGTRIEQEDAEHLFRAVQAMTSPNASPFSNMQRTDQVLNKFFNSDESVRTSSLFGVAGPSIQKGLSRYMAVVERLGKRTDGSVDVAEGLKRSRELFTGSVMTPSDAKAMFNELLGADPKSDDYKPSNYVVTENVPLFSVFGPKVGPFFANNNGETDHLTADVWWTRTWGRNSGELLVEPSPTKGAEHAVEAARLLKKAKPDQLHGVDAKALESSINEMKKTGLVDDIVRAWSSARNRHYANTDYKEKTGTAGLLNKIAKNIVDNDYKLMGDPGGGRRRSSMLSVAREAAKRVGLSPAYMQDVLWQDEQDAYAALGAKTITGMGKLSLYSDAIRDIHQSSSRLPMAEHENAKPKRASAKKKSKRSQGGDESVEQPYDDYDRGGREQMLYEHDIAEISDDKFVEILLKYAKKAKRHEPESRSDNCGRQEKGRFGKGNDCAADGPSGKSDSESAASSKSSAWGKEEQSWGKNNDTEVWRAEKPLFAGAENIKSIEISRPSDLKQILSDSVKMSLPEVVSAVGVPASKAGAGVINKPIVSIFPAGDSLGVRWQASGKSTGEGFQFHEKPFARDIGGTVVAAQANREIHPTKAGPVMSLVAMIVHPDFQRKGIASEAVLRATSAPVADIKMVAARAEDPDPHFRLTGYSVWPKFGYNASIKDVWKAIDSESEMAAMRSGGNLEMAAQIVDDAEYEYNDLFSGRAKPRSIIDVFSVPGGQEWWTKYGGDITLHFDKRPRSQSQETLLRYLEARKKKSRSEAVTKDKSDRAADWDITDEDEAVLEQVWEEIRKSPATPATDDDVAYLEERQEKGAKDGDSGEV